uniref:(northern house mosquito) hypothetical protein n=1 Tax=Culex pipiens TaxID=7175 RepID=A0A8D8BBX1_CULPI
MPAPAAATDRIFERGRCCLPRGLPIIFLGFFDFESPIISCSSSSSSCKKGWQQQNNGRSFKTPNNKKTHTTIAWDILSPVVSRRGQHRNRTRNRPVRPFGPDPSTAECWKLWTWPSCLTSGVAGEHLADRFLFGRL